MFFMHCKYIYIYIYIYIVTKLRWYQIITNKNIAHWNKLHKHLNEFNLRKIGCCREPVDPRQEKSAVFRSACQTRWQYYRLVKYIQIKLKTLVLFNDDFFLSERLTRFSASWRHRQVVVLVARRSRRAHQVQVCPSPVSMLVLVLRCCHEAGELAA